MTSVVKKKPKVVIPTFESTRGGRVVRQESKKAGSRYAPPLRGRDTATLAEALAKSATKEKARLKPVTIRMRPDDLEAVRGLALEKGLPYQTYIKVQLRDALRRVRASR